MNTPSASRSSYIPSDEELARAVEDENSLLLSQYAIAYDRARTVLNQEIPGLIEAASNSKRNLDMCKAAIKSHDSTINLIQSVLRQLRA